MTCKTLLFWTSAVFGFIAAVLWMIASFRKVEFDPEVRDDAGNYPGAIIASENGQRVDFLKTAESQTYWNGWAAIAASIAAATNAGAGML